MIKIKNITINTIKWGRNTISLIKTKFTTVFEAISGCFTSGYWRNDKKWTNDKGWRNN